MWVVISKLSEQVPWKQEWARSLEKRNRILQLLARSHLQIKHSEYALTTNINSYSAIHGVIRHSLTIASFDHTYLRGLLIDRFPVTSQSVQGGLCLPMSQSMQSRLCVPLVSQKIRRHFLHVISHKRKMRLHTSADIFQVLIFLQLRMLFP